MATTLCTQTDIENRLSSAGLINFGDDNSDGILDAGLVTAAIERATAKVFGYCCRYDSDQLNTSPMAKHWCVTLALRWIGTRRLNPRPQSLIEEYKETIEELKAVQKGALLITGTTGLPLPLRSNYRPAATNIRVDQRYHTKKTRVERVISTEQNTDHPQSIDYYGDYDVEP